MKNFRLTDMRAMIKEPKLQEVRDVLPLLRHWSRIVPDDIRPNGVGLDAYKLLSWMIRGRVAETIWLLEESNKSVDQRAAKRIRTLGDRTLTVGPAMAKVMALSFWGYIGVELGNPTWVDSKGVIIVELPNSNPVRYYLEMIGGSYGQNEFFRNGYIRKDGARDDQLEAVHALVDENGLRSYCLLGRGIWVFSAERAAEEASRQRKCQTGNDVLDELRNKAQRALKEALEAYGADFSPKVLPPEVREELIGYMRKRIGKQI